MDFRLILNRFGQPGFAVKFNDTFYVHPDDYAKGIDHVAQLPCRDLGWYELPKRVIAGSWGNL